MSDTEVPAASTPPNSPIECFRGAITLNDGNHDLTADGHITWRWLPRPTLAFQIPAARGWVNMLNEVTLRIPGGGPAKARIARMQSGSHEPTRIVGQLVEQLEIGSGTSFHEARFQVPNLSAFISVPNDGSPDWQMDRIKLSGGGWDIVIDPVPHLEQLREEMREVGGFGITHTARARRTDGSAFGRDQVSELASCLYYFLSFVEGNWTGAILPRGCDAKGDELWRAYAPWRIAPQQDVLSWADRHGGGLLSGAFRGFMSRWNDAAWREVLKLAIYWYVESNRNGAGLEAGIILSQSALDAIAWEYLVHENRIVSKGQFKGMSAAVRMRHVAKRAQIPLLIPADAPATTHNAAAQQWADLADAITVVRNKIVHPDSANRDQLFVNEMLRETWQLGMWLLELTVLWLIGFGGTYNDRRKTHCFVGDVATVPWAAPSSSAP